MRFRLRLALAFLLLSALPLTLLALYSFTSSSNALRSAAESEAQVMARELEQRVGWAASEINQRLKAVAHLPAKSWLQPDGAPTAPPADEQAFAELARALPFLEGFHFVPRTPPAPGTARAGATPVTAPTAALRAGVAASGPEMGETLEKMLLLAGKQTVAALGKLPDELPPAERARIREQLEAARKEIARALVERTTVRTAGMPPPAPAAEAPVAAPREPAAAIPPEVPPFEAPPASPVPAVDASGPLAQPVACTVTEDGQVVGELRGKIKARELLQTVLSQAHREQGEIPFALDSKNQLFVARDEDGEQLSKLPAVAAMRKAAPPEPSAGASEWVVVTRTDPTSGMRFGIARPLSRALAQLKRATARNFASGLALVALATVAMVPLSSGLVRNVRRLEDGAARIAQGDLTTRVPVTSRDEFGRLAASFNHMAEQLSEHQVRLLEQERRQKAQELERRLLEAENERRGQELEEARRFQLSLLPRELPSRDELELAVAMSTATEVGGDYYDFREAANGELLIAIGDATGHGAAAGTMVTVVKSLFMAGAEEHPPATFLRRATGLVHGMGLARMAMALAVARFDGRRLVYSSAGMPPALHYAAATGEVREEALPGMPLGSRPDFDYGERSIELAAGDALLLTSDGFPELQNAAGEPFGYERARLAFARVAARPATEILSELERVTHDWLGEAERRDDVTFLVLKRRA